MVEINNRRVAGHDRTSVIRKLPKSGAFTNGGNAMTYGAIALGVFAFVAFQVLIAVFIGRVLRSPG